METMQKKILIIDDNLLNIDVLLKNIDQYGYKTLIAENGDIGVQRADYAQPDLILLDIMMPGIDGFETCRQLKENPRTKDIPIIYMTALSGTSSRVKGFESGAVDYITKPFEQAEVLARIQTHLTIQDQKKQLEELNRTKDVFFSILAHDLRGAFLPLVGSVGILERLLIKNDDAKLKKFFLHIKKSVMNVSKLLENLLSWGRLQRNLLEAKPENIDIFKLMEWLISLYQEQATHKKIKFSHSIPKNISVWADSNMVETIFRNLINNAIKFTNIGGIVTITAYTEDNKTIINIEDTGNGISPDRLPDLFKTDVKSKTKGTAGEIGTGLGLILCHDLVRLNNGSINVESIVNKGTIFSVKLPAKSPE